MKKKVFIALAAIALSIAAFANPSTCGIKTCPGGNQKCCTDSNGSTWYNDAAENENP